MGALAAIVSPYDGGLIHQPIDFVDQVAYAVGAAAQCRLKYNDSVPALQVSYQGAAYASLATTASATLQGAYTNGGLNGGLVTLSASGGPLYLLNPNAAGAQACLGLDQQNAGVSDVAHAPHLRFYTAGSITKPSITSDGDLYIKGTQTTSATTITIQGANASAGANIPGGQILVTTGGTTGSQSAGITLATTPSQGAGSGANAAVNRVAITGLGTVVLNASGSALALGATDGFTSIPSCAGTPTGVPSASAMPTGTSSIIVDSTNSIFYYRSGGAWVAAAAAATSTLQAAYNAGNTVVATAARAIAFSNAVDATDLLTLTRTFAGAGAALSVSMGASTTDNGVEVAASGSGRGLLVTMAASSTNAGVEVNAASGSTGGALVVTGLATSAAVGLIVASQNQSATSGTARPYEFGSTLSDGGTNSTTTAQHFYVNPLVNYTGATRTGSYTALQVDVTETSIPDGPNYLFRFRNGASGNTEVMRLRSTNSAGVPNTLQVVEGVASITNTGATGTTTLAIFNTPSGADAANTFTISTGANSSGFVATMNQSGTGGGLAITMPSGASAASALTIIGNTQTLTAAPITITQTWNAGGATFRGIEYAVTNTASAAASTLLRLQAGAGGATEVFTVTTTGLLSLPAIASNAQAIIIGPADATGFSFRPTYSGRLSLLTGNAGALAAWNMSALQVQTTTVISAQLNLTLAPTSGSAVTLTGGTVTTNAPLITTTQTQNATSGTVNQFNFAGTMADGGTNSTTVARGLYLNPTYNYTGATRSGSTATLQLDQVQTSMPTGSNHSILIRGGAAGTTTNWAVDSNGYQYGPTGWSARFYSQESASACQQIFLPVGTTVSQTIAVQPAGSPTTTVGVTTFSTGWELYQNATADTSIWRQYHTAVGYHNISTITGAGTHKPFLWGRVDGTRDDWFALPSSGAGAQVTSDGIFGGTNSATDATGAADWGMSRNGATSDIAFGNGTAANKAGILNYTTGKLEGLVARYNAVTTAGMGHPAIYAAGEITAQSSNATIASFSTTPAGDFFISATVNVSAATAISTSVEVTYRDTEGNSRTTSLPIQLSGGTGGTYLASGLIIATGDYSTPVTVIRVQASSTIVVRTAVGTFTGVTYSASATISRVR